MPYLNSSIKRFLVPDDKVAWSTEWSSYAPVEYTDPSINGKPWADTNDLSNVKFNALDGKVNRRSYIWYANATARVVRCAYYSSAEDL